MVAGDERVQIIVSPAGERCAVVPEHEYLVAASKEDEGEPTPEFLAEIRRRSQALAQSRSLKSVDQTGK
jgi:hypothetical protein